MERTNKLILTLFLLSALLHLYVALRLTPDLTDNVALTSVFLALLSASGYLIPSAMIKSRQQHSLGNTLIIWCGLVFMGLLSSMLVFTLVRDLLIISMLLIQQTTTHLLLTPGWYHITACSVVTLSALISIWGFLRILMGPSIVNIDVPIDQLPSGLENFSVAQLSDIHIGPTIKRRFLEKVVHRTNQLKPDAVVITGDLIDGPVSQLGAEVSPLQQLESCYGTYFVTGNHEYYSRADQWIEHLKTLGLQVLLNQHKVLQHNRESVVIAGITDFSAHHFIASQRSDPQQALANAPTAAGLTILLAHQPRSLFQATKLSVDIQLSGHTHGGQFWPWNHFVPLQQPYTSGLHRVKNMWIYVSKGTGYWGPPKRFGAPPEITMFRFKRANSTP